jgi:hypothetical protein
MMLGPQLSRTIFHVSARSDGNSSSQQQQQQHTPRTQLNNERSLSRGEGVGAGEESKAKQECLWALCHRCSGPKACSLTREVRLLYREYIIRQGDIGDAFYIILEGLCTVTHEQMGVINQLFASDSFGEVALLEVVLQPSRTTPLCSDRTCPTC